MALRRKERLGIYFLDGCISLKTNCISWGLAISDIEILDFIKKEISPDRPYYINNKTNIVYLNIYSPKLKNDFANFGIVPQKTGKEILIDIPEQFKFDYLRGFFDGDGSISIRECSQKNQKIWRCNRLSFSCSSKSCLEQINDKICNRLGNI